MFALKVFRKVSKFKNFPCDFFRFMSVEDVALKNTQTDSRRYIKPVSTRKLKSLNENVLRCLFRDTIDKNLFQYPAIFRSGDTDVILNHTGEVESFLSNNLKAKVTEGIVTKLKELELFGLSIPHAYGGAGYTNTEAKFLLECTGINPRIAKFLNYHDLGCTILELYGSEEQKKKYLPRLSAGKSYMALAYLENGPLVDLSAFKGYAIVMEEENQVILNTQKKWVHNAEMADLFLVMVKSAFQDSDAGEIKVKFSMFIVEREIPGITIHKLMHKNAQDCDLYDVSFKDVLVPFDNILGCTETDGYEVLKSALSHSSLSESAICCSLIKCIIHYASQFIHENSLGDTSVRGNGFLLENLASLSVYAFGLESLIYMVAGRHDMYEKPDLFNESILVKTLAIDFLQIAIKKYIEIVGRETFKASGILEEALQTLHHFSIFDENIEYLKMMIAADGLVCAAPALSTKVNIIRKPFEYAWEGLKQGFSSEEQYMKQAKLKHKFKMEFPAELTPAANMLEMNCAKLQTSIEELFYIHGSLLMNNEHYVIKFAEIASYLFALIASLARASNSLCYKFEGYKNDFMMAQSFACVANSEINHLINENMKYQKLNEHYRTLGKMTFNQKEYPAEHPLSRTY